MKDRPKLPIPIDSAEAEANLLGACLIDGGATLLAAQAGGAVPAWFSTPLHRLTYEAICNLYARCVPFDTAVLAEELRSSGRLEEVGGLPAIVGLTQRVPTTAQAAYYIERVRSYFRKREQLRIATALREAVNSDDEDEVRRQQARLLELAETNGQLGTLPVPMDYNQLCNSSLSPPVPVIEGLLHRGAKMVLGGGSKTYKTWSLSDLAISVASGATWWGLKTYPGRVLYINLELDPWHYRDRLQRIAAAKATSPGSNFEVWNLRGHAADLEKLMPDLLSRTVGKGYALIVIDPIYKVLGRREENAAEQMAELLNLLEKLAVQSGAAIVFGAHFSKGNQAGKEAMDRISGSGVFGRDPDTILTLTRHEEEGAFTVDMTLRNHAPIAPFVVRWDAPLMVPDGRLDPAKLRQVSGRPKRYSESDLLDVLIAKGMTSAEWEIAAKGRSGIARSRFHELRRDLVASGRVQCVSGVYRLVSHGQN
jgi:hypothetical protein